MATTSADATASADPSGVLAWAAACRKTNGVMRVFEPIPSDLDVTEFAASASPLLHASRHGDLETVEACRSFSMPDRVVPLTVRVHARTTLAL